MSGGSGYGQQQYGQQPMNSFGGGGLNYGGAQQPKSTMQSAYSPQPYGAQPPDAQIGGPGDAMPQPVGVAAPTLDYGGFGQQPPGMAEGPWDGMRRPPSIDQGPWDGMRKTQTPLGMAQPDAFEGGGMGGAGVGGLSQQPSGSYEDYMNRRNAWIDKLRGYVAQPQPIGGQPPPTWGGQPGPGAPPVTSVPPGGPAPGPTKGLLGGQPDFMSQFGQLLGEDPRLAYGMTYGSQQQPWYQQNQLQIRDKYFGGDQNRMNQVMNQAAYANPLTAAERARLGI